MRVLNYDGAPIEGYAVANLLHVVPALDRARSTYRVFGPERPDREGQIWALRRAVLRPDALDGYDVLRLAEYPLYVCVSERFRRAFEDAGCTGYGFRALVLS